MHECYAAKRQSPTSGCIEKCKTVEEATKAILNTAQCTYFHANQSQHKKKLDALSMIQNLQTLICTKKLTDTAKFPTQMNKIAHGLGVKSP